MRLGDFACCDDVIRRLDHKGTLAERRWFGVFNRKHDEVEENGQVRKSTVALVTNWKSFFEESMCAEILLTYWYHLLSITELKLGTAMKKSLSDAGTRRKKIAQLY